MLTIGKSRSNSARVNIETALKKTKEFDSHNIFISLCQERALERADLVDSGKLTGKLAGVPFVVKDNYLTFGGPTTAASNILKNFQAPLQATVIERLEAEGAICIGKANLDAFAHGSSTENSAFGPTKNAVDPSKVAGGSSGGSAVSVALDIVPFALGSDTGGSIRQPASFNGVFGVKPTYGMTSRYGVVAMASSTDVMGCFTNSAEDAELVLSIMAGRDERDMTSLPDYFVPSSSEPERLRIGVINDFMGEGTDPEVVTKVNEYVEKMKKAGHEVGDASLPMAKYSLAIYYIVVPAEITSNLARYDGVRYGMRAQDVSTIAELYGKSRDEGFMPENKRRIMIGSYVLSSGYFDAYYQKAQKARRLLINEFEELFKQFDVLVSPVTPTPAFGLGENTADPIKMYLSDAMTVGASLAGLPAVSVPAGSTKEGLPVGVQLIAAYKHDALMLNLAKSMEENDG
ncbi:MAG TPA: Asp-tRNA(Asn)/Glu-tRNA(Gln) amidotransferase subunit GatA [Candidatus Saccharibacteria bacterium]|nr:Asp-tRNA(Asn)/Glu-tRNA(Gln) amidotransferase subunit GatA [Candidatus Saccharibacteria bacterium]HRK94479.1 Asp-tRNA(Asn)/Glu-tRNA(Gln) amidotransferase subunit GatA [Candidatus Saccharibacteria bacterium]